MYLLCLACEPPPPPFVYINLLYKHVLNESYNPPPWLARLMPCPDAVMFLRTAGPLPRFPSPLSIENAVMGSKAVASAIRREALQLSKLGKRRRRKNGKRAGEKFVTDPRFHVPCLFRPAANVKERST